MRRIVVTVLAAGLLGTLIHAATAAVSTTKHNLSVSGPGPIRATSEQEICIFCHTPHRSSAAAPLWNRRQPGSTYQPYTSSTAKGGAGQPNGASLLCLSCHDGTIALGEVLSRDTPIAMSGGVTTLPTGSPGRLGTDLRDDHPISFSYATARNNNPNPVELTDPALLTGAVKLDKSGQMQCTSCHDPHNDPNGKFLVLSNRGGTLCATCHNKSGWTQSAHRSSTRGWNGSGTDPWPYTTWSTVADNACQNCHRPHAAGGAERLLNYAVEEANCSACHNGNVAAKNIMNEFNKASIHPIATDTGVHQPLETAVVPSATRHVECVDCHNPHAARSGAGVAGVLAGVRGVDTNNVTVNTASFEYQICYRCHGDSTGKPAPRTTRMINESNVRIEFDPGNPAFHPIETRGRNNNVPSLIAPWTTASTVKCTDCHNNNNGPGAGGTGPNGPHGSSFVPLLERQYLTQDPNTESAAAYALCYKCHNRASILGNQSFPLHSFHIGGGGMGGGGMGEVNAPCNTCHDPHGFPINASSNGKLINFNTSVVRASSSGILRYESTGTFAGSCWLTCHGKNHNPCSYGGGMGGGMCGGGGGGGGGMGN